MLQKKKNRTKNLFVHSWWCIAFLLICLSVYANGMYKKNKVFSELSERKYHLENEFQAALKKREDLLLQIESQNDPAWIQMLLMKKLGVVPEGQVKVYFEDK